MISFYALVFILLLLHMVTHCGAHRKEAKEFTAPKMLYPNRTETLYYRLGSNISLQCKANASGNIRYKWVYNDTEIDNSTKVTFNEGNGTLNICNFTGKEAGEYRCFVNSSFDGDKVSTPVIIMAPALRLMLYWIDIYTNLSTTKLVVRKSDHVVLKCLDNEEVLTPPARYVWYEAATNRTVDRSKGRLYTDIRGHLHITHLMITDSATGGFYCMIFSRLGNSVIERKGNVIKLEFAKNYNFRNETEPVFRRSNYHIELTSTFTASLECVFSGFGGSQGIPFQYWLDGNNQSVPINEKYQVSTYGRTLTIYKLMQTDSQTYTCVANSSMGTAFGYIYISVYPWPGFFDDSPKDEVILEHSNVAFKCRAKSNFNEPTTSSPIWYFNGQIITGNKSFKFSEENTTLTVVNVSKKFHIGCVQCEVPCVSVMEKTKCTPVWGNGCLFVLERINVTTSFDQKMLINKDQPMTLTVSATTDPSLELRYLWSINNECFMSNILHINSCYAASENSSIVLHKTKEKDDKLFFGNHKLNIYNDFDNYSFEAMVAVVEPKNSEQLDRLVLGLVVGACVVFLLLANLFLIIKMHRASSLDPVTVEYSTLLAKPIRFRKGTNDSISTNYFDEQSVPSTSGYNDKALLEHGTLPKRSTYFEEPTLPSLSVVNDKTLLEHRAFSKRTTYSEEPSMPSRSKHGKTLLEHRSMSRPFSL